MFWTETEPSHKRDQRNLYALPHTKLFFSSYFIAIWRSWTVPAHIGREIVLIPHGREKEIRKKQEQEGPLLRSERI